MATYLFFVTCLALVHFCRVLPWGHDLLSSLGFTLIVVFRKRFPRSSRSSRKSQLPSPSMHRQRLGTTRTHLSYRLGLADKGRATAFPTRSGALVANVHQPKTERPLRFHAPQRPPRRGGGGVRRHRRGGPEAPRDNLIAVHRLPRRVGKGASHEVSPWRSHPDPDEHLPARSPSGSTPSVGTTLSSRVASERPSGHPDVPRPPS